MIPSVLKQQWGNIYMMSCLVKIHHRDLLSLIFQNIAKTKPVSIESRCVYQYIDTFSFFLIEKKKKPCKPHKCMIQYCFTPLQNKPSFNDHKKMKFKILNG